MIEIYAVNIPTDSEKNPDDRPYRERLQELSPRQKTSYQALVSALDRRLVKKIISERKNIPLSAIDFSYSKYGKPFVKNDQTIHFNLSHSGSWIVCAIGPRPVGIDIQLVTPFSIQVAKKFFSNDEFSDLMNEEESHRTGYFFELWTLKECFLKAIGMGFAFPFRAVTIKKSRGNIYLKDNPFPVDFSFKQFDIADSYKIALCSSDHHFHDCITEVRLEDLL